MGSLEEELAPYVEQVGGSASPTLVVGEEGFPFDHLEALLAAAIPSRYVAKVTPSEVREIAAELDEGSRVQRVAFRLVGASGAAQNAMLKFLEDSPFAITVYAHGGDIGGAVLPTILSRCFLCALPPASPGLLGACLALRRVPASVIARIPSTYLGSIAGAELEFGLDTTASVSALLKALEAGDIAQAFRVSRGFGRPDARRLALAIRSHLSGMAVTPAFTRVSGPVLARWSELLESTALQPGLAVRWGILEADHA